MLVKWARASGEAGEKGIECGFEVTIVREGGERRGGW